MLSGHCAAGAGEHKVKSGDYCLYGYISHLCRLRNISHVKLFLLPTCSYDKIDSTKDWGCYFGY